MHALLRELIGQIAPRPYHVVVNGWYFYSINFISGGAFLRSLPGMLVGLVRHPRHIAGIIPPTVRYSFPVVERTWREDLQPRYRASVAASLLRQAGFEDVSWVANGVPTWRAAGFPVERGEAKEDESAAPAAASIHAH